MTTKPKKRPRDPVQLGKLIVEIATGQVEDVEVSTKDPAAVSRGRLGGIKGGPARAEALPSDRKREIAKAAAGQRWDREPPKN